MAEQSGQSVVAALGAHILPLVRGLQKQLESGIDVLDVGCGGGHALVHLAQRFPASRFTGFDLGSEVIRSARHEAARAGLSNVRFEVRDVAELDDEARWDWITAFDAIHEQARPDLVLSAIRRGLRPRGVFLMQEIQASSHLRENLEHPIGAFLYAISCMYCMSVSIARDGLGLGACWGRERAAQMLREAGFTQLERHTLPHDRWNDYWIVRP
jgi:2-polyprenyl-3-methyl-5-hydroxy-6-metoxy-1,4-benzoquinol methylase